MRQIVFDTETTGVNPTDDRVVEIGAIELNNMIPTGREFHRFIHPERDVPDEVVKVHGLTYDFLKDFRVFGDPTVVDEFLAFVGESDLIAHNASFDRNFVNSELARLNRAPIDDDRFVDTLAMARKAFPNANNTLDGLCKRFGISLEQRQLHGAILDSRLLAEVYLELNGGRSRAFSFDGGEALETSQALDANQKARQRPRRLPPRLTDQEIDAHSAFVATLADGGRWPDVGSTGEPIDR